MTEPIAVVGYREWAKELFSIVRSEGIDVRWCDSLNGAYRHLVYLVGWSEIVPEEFYRDRTVLVLHPSPLPLYRGGSPIQHQIIDGRDASAVSLFKLDAEHPRIDSGPLAWQQGYSLAGTLADVLGRIARIGAQGVVETALAFDRGDLAFWEQPSFVMPAYRKRRTPDESEITADLLDGATARQMHDFIRSLQDPYPVAFIRMADGRKLYINQTTIEEDAE